MIDTTGHTNNHDGDSHGFAMMVFKVEIDRFIKLKEDTLTMRELT